MKTGIIGLPQVGKTSLFRILTKAHLSEGAYANPREAHLGVAKVPDDRLDKLAALYKPKKTVYATVEYADVAAVGQEALKERRTPDLEKEHALLLRCKQQLEQEKPLREMEMSAEEKKLIRGFMFLSQKPILFVLNITESPTLGADLESAVAR